MMTTHADELILLSESVELSFDTFVELSGLTPAELQLLIDCGAIIPCQMTEISSLETIKFNSHYLISIRKLVRLKQDFELETNLTWPDVGFFRARQNIGAAIAPINESK